MRYFNLPPILLLLLVAATTHAQEPVTADQFSQRGISRFEKLDFDGAIADFTKAIELNGQQLEYCFYFRGIALYRRGRLDEAITDLGKAIALKPHSRFYDDRGNLLAQKGDVEGAFADLSRAIEIDPKNAKAYGDRGIVRLMRGEDAAAELDFKTCFELDRALESQFKAAANQIKQQAVLRAEHQTPVDVEIVKFNWTEAPSRVLNVPTSAPVPVTTTPVSRTGLRVLGSTDKGEPGPPVPGNQPGPDSFDPLSLGRSTSGSPATRVRGVDYKFTVSLKNTGKKTITTVHWAYFFVPQNTDEAFAFVFSTKIELPPGREKNLRDEVPWATTKSQSKAPTAHNRAQFTERVVILRLEYSDGSSWRSSGKPGTP